MWVSVSSEAFLSLLSHNLVHLKKPGCSPRDGLISLFPRTLLAPADQPGTCKKPGLQVGLIKGSPVGSWHLPSLWPVDVLSVTRARVVDKSDSEIGVIWGGETPFPPSEVCPHQSTLPPSSLLTGFLAAHRQRQAWSGRGSRTGFLPQSGSPREVSRLGFPARTQEMG